MSTSIELNKETCIDLLKRYIDAGYKSTGVISIKEGAVIHKYFRILKGTEKPTDDIPKEAELFKIVFKVLEVLNNNKAFTLDDAAVIDRIVSFIEESVLKGASSPEAVDPEEKIKEVK